MQALVVMPPALQLIALVAGSECIRRLRQSIFSDMRSLYNLWRLWRFDMAGASLNVLVVEDEPAMRRLLCTILEAQGHTVTEAAGGRSGLEMARNSQPPDLLLLDLTLPDIGGFKIIEELRASGPALPIIVLSNRGDESAKVTALDLGADDYVAKPFGAQELLARIRAATRHLHRRKAALFRAGALTVDYMSRKVTLAGQEIKLSRKEYELLASLIKNAGQVVTHSRILREVWGGEAADAQYVRIYVRSLRQKLQETPENPRYILTEQGVGYRFGIAEEGE
jgi:two-component system, OmpR family, KDP operon response regulator KdpE